MRSTNLSSEQNTLYQALKTEVSLMRELLANLHEEELCLLEQNQSGWLRIMNERSELVMQVREQRASRISATCSLEKFAAERAKTEHLPADEVMTCEVISQVDQLFALIDRTNLQNCRNDALFLQALEKNSLPLHCSFPHPLHQPEAKPRKTATATQPRKKP